MKKVFLLAAAGLIATAGFSQVRFGGQVIGNYGTASMEQEESEGVKKKGVIGFGAGVVSEIELSKSLSLRPSLNYLKKGVKLDVKAETDFGTIEGDMKVNMNFVELPVVLAYNFPLSNGKFYVGAGPSVGYGFSGKSKSTFTVSIPGFPLETETEEVETFKKEEDGGAGFKRFDMSANVIAGIQLNNGFYVNAGGLFGLSNLGEKDSKYRNVGAQLTVGFLLNKN